MVIGRVAAFPTTSYHLSTMIEQPPIRRYLTNFDSARTGNILTDVLVVGSGVAGLSATIAAAAQGEVILVTKGNIEESATQWAQGGIAAVLSREDSLEQHVVDTLGVGCGLNRRAAVERIIRTGAEMVRNLVSAGLPFDRRGAQLEFGLEAGHNHPRILHAGGDATGKALGEFLYRQAAAQPSVRVFTRCFLIDLLTVEGRCAGAVTYHPKYGHQLIWARCTILATGGCGQVYRETTNPAVATGDGPVAALRAGARVADMEMIQFHPTTLYVAGSTRALISEAVRGEGAHLVDKQGRRFMADYHPDGELAPRDVVSRAIGETLKRTEATCVYLDVRHLGRDRFARRFPTITARCADFGIDVGRDLIPVRPAAHFAIGGVVADLDGRTSLPGLLCCGEAACTGLHGANRLASNSLLEGLVLGRAAAVRAGAELAANPVGGQVVRVRHDAPPSPKTALDLGDVRQSLRSIMWRNAGIARHGDRLAETIEIIDFWSKFVLDKTFDDPSGWEVQNLLVLGRLLAAAALRRRESRGVHYRLDHSGPPDPELAGHFAWCWRDGAVREEYLDLDMQPTSPGGPA